MRAVECSAPPIGGVEHPMHTVGMSDTKEPTSPKRQEAKLLDLTRFESLEHAVTLADEVGRDFTKLGRLGLQDSNLTDLKLFYMSALARAHSLHDAIVREI